MPYLILAVRVGGGLAKLLPMVGNAADGLAQVGEKVGQAALGATNILFEELTHQKELDVCIGVKNFLTTAEGQLTDAEKKLGPMNKPDLRSLQSIICRLCFIMTQYPFIFLWVLFYVQRTLSV